MARILIIDDDEHMRYVLSQLLAQAGYGSIEAPNGEVGLQLFQQQEVDLVITDLFMPHQEGLETIMLLQAVAPHLQIVAISGGGTHGLVNFLDTAKKLGAQRTLTKPLDMELLLTTVHELLEVA